MNPSQVDFFISCVPGLEPVLLAECQALGFMVGNKSSETDEGLSPILGERGGVQFSGTLDQVMLGNLHLRTASRILIRFAEFYSAAFSELEKKTSRLDWDRYLLPGRPINLRVTCHKSKLYHSDAVAERVLNSINRVLASSSSNKKPVQISKDGQTVVVRLFHDLCTISIDSSGDLLHKRGYRLETAKAPLRETLAAGLVLSTGWTGQVPLFDPFCGSGTIPIEAALIAQQIPPGMGRKFAFMNWPGFDKSKWDQILESARSKICHPETMIRGYDRDSGAVDAAIANASRAGQKNEIFFSQQPISLFEPTPSTGWIITNPPYGVRVSANKDLRDLYARFGSILKTKFGGWQVGILCNDPVLIGNLGLGQPEKTINLVNGGIPVKFLSYWIE